MEDDNTTQCAKLRELLREQATEVPPCDLEHGFLQDLHHKISTEQNRTSLWAVLKEKYESLTASTLGWAGGALAALALTIAVGYQMKPTAESETLAELNIGNYDLVNSYQHIDLAGNIPAFTKESYDF